MTEINRCHEQNCPAACCRNIYGYLPGTENYFLKVFPEATPVSDEGQLIENVKSHKSGVYYFADRSWLYFSVSGDCPNLDDTMNCKIHNSGSYLAACRNMVTGSEECEKSQSAHRKNLIYELALSK
jgi:Fe-S-cluster containining protein